MLIYHFKNVSLFLAVFAIVAGVFVFGIFRSPKPAEVFSGIPHLGTEPEMQTSGPLLTAVSSHSFISDVLQQVGGSFVDVRTIPVGKMSAQEYAQLGDVDVLFVLDDLADAWLVQILQENKHTRIFRLREGRQEFSPNMPFADKRRYDEEYYWLSPDEIGRITHFIAREYGQLDSVHTLQYLNNAYSYEYKLNELSQTISDSLGSAARASFSSYGYGFTPVLAAYDLKLGAYVPAIRDVQKRLADHPKEYMFVDVAFPVSGITNAAIRKRVIALDPYGNLFSGDTYVDFIRENMGKLLEL